MLHHTARGQGSRPTVLVHGFLGSGRNLGAVARSWDTVAPDRRFLLVDLLGHGRSPALPEGAGLDAMADALLEWFEAQALPLGTDIVGHSLGGRVALQARLQDSKGHVGRIGLLDIRPGPIVGSETEKVIHVLLHAPVVLKNREAMRDWLEGAGLARLIADWLLMSGENRPLGFGWRIDREELARFHRDNRAVDLWSAVRAHPDTAVVRGGASEYVREEDRARFEALGVPVETIEGAGHFLHAERTEMVTAALHRLMD